MLTLTKHARARFQQRGISQDVLIELIDFGEEIHDHRGGSVVYFDQRARDRLRRNRGGEEYRRLESHLNAYAVIGREGQVVTVGHRTRRLFRH